MRWDQPTMWWRRVQAGSVWLLAGLSKALLRTMQHRPWVRLTPCTGHSGMGCYGAAEIPQCLLLPEHEVVAKQCLVKARGPAHASEYRSEQTMGLRTVSCPHPPPKKCTYSQTSSIFFESSLLETGYWLRVVILPGTVAAVFAHSPPQWKQPACGRPVLVSLALISCTFWVRMCGLLLVWLTAQCQVVKHPEGFNILHLPLGQQILAFHISTRHNFKPFTGAEFSKTPNPPAWQHWQHFYIHCSLSLFKMASTPSRAWNSGCTNQLKLSH